MNYVKIICVSSSEEETICDYEFINVSLYDVWIRNAN